MTGDLPINIEWRLNDAPIDESRISISKVGKRVSLLTIDSVTGYHAGNYTCVALNPAGSAEHSSRLIVNGI